MREESGPPTSNQPGFTTITSLPTMHQSRSHPVQTPFPLIERAGFTTITTPIDALSFSHLVPFLHMHGASVEAVGEKQTYLAHLPGGKRRRRTFRLYRVAFPEGMQRLDGPATRYLVPFTLLFPDGARLQGRINTISDVEEIILGLPTRQAHLQDEHASSDSPPL